MTTGLDALEQELIEIRRDIHRHPEVAFDEFRTSDIVAKQLGDWGIEVHRGLARTGVVGTLRAGTSNRAIGLRADMDALPIQEANRFDHRSVYDGKMHACGHDGPTTMLLGAAKVLAESRNFDGVVHFIFQPAEENEGGGRVMIEEGLFDLFPVEQVYGMHNMPGIPAGSFAMRTGPIMAAFDSFDIILRGKGTHAAMPHLGIDPVVIAAELVTALQTIVSRSVNPLENAVVSVTQFHGGEAYNVIPEEIRLAGCTRSFLPPIQEQIEQTMGRIVSGIAAAHGATFDFDYRRGYPPTINTEEEVAAAAAAAIDVAGAGNVDTDTPPLMGSEDFAFMLQERPGSYIFIGNGNREGTCMVHNPGYDFNDEIIIAGVSYWTRLVERGLPI
ncbi:MAG: amidohydrolase [Rhodospirillales bacterium]|nr:amidohydrolase [Rhodospirillales bacterium]